MQTTDRRLSICQPELLGAVFAQLGRKRALAATSKAWHAAAWAAQDAAGGFRLSMRAREGPEGAAKLQSLVDFLVRRRPRVADVFMSLDPNWGLHGTEPSPGDRERMRCLACAVLALLSGQPFQLTLRSYIGAGWMPRLPLVTDSGLGVYESDTDFSIDWLADRLPNVEVLWVRCSPAYYDPDRRGWLSAGAPLPPVLRRLSVNGFLPGIERTFAQLDSLSVDMLLRENHAEGPIPSSILEAAAQATRLTELTLSCPYPEDVDFFVHLSAATQLRSLRIDHGLTDEPAFTFENEDAEMLLDQALGKLTALTALSLSGMCQQTVLGAVGAMSALQKLEIASSEGVADLPAGPFRSSLTELQADWGLAEAALRVGPVHSLWDLPQLRVLSAWGMGDASAADKAAFRAAAAERLPGLQKLDI